MLLGDVIRLPVTWYHNKVSNVANMFGQNQYWQIKVEELLLHCNWPEMGKSSNFTYLPTLIAALLVDVFGMQLVAPASWVGEGIVRCTPTNIPLWEIPTLYKPYVAAIYVFFHPQQSLENTVNTMVETFCLNAP